MKRSLIIIFIVFIYAGMNAATVDTLSVYSPSMNKDIKACVIIPEGYSKDNKFNFRKLCLPCLQQGSIIG